MIPNPGFRRLFLLTLPALLVGLALRVALMISLPQVIVHPDSGDLLRTPDALIHDHRLSIHSKKTFLTPVLYTLAFAVPKMPKLAVIALAQHLAGLATVAVVALLCRLWFRRWEWAVPPVTLLVAANPSLLWFEHALMAETLFVFCTALLALAGTLYAMAPGRRTFLFLCVALVLEAGARPEGKLFFAFGFLLVALVAWPRWRQALRPMGYLFLVAMVTYFATLTSQAGLLLYTSVLRIAPEPSRVAPGVEAYTAPLRDELIREWASHPVFPKSSQRAILLQAVRTYLEDRQQPSEKKDVERLCKRLGMEACLRNPMQLPGLVLHKWRTTASQSPAEDFLGMQPGSARQERAVANARVALVRNAAALTGRSFETGEAVLAGFRSIETGTRTAWLRDLTRRWADAAAKWHTPSTRHASGPAEPGIPLYMLAALAGFLVLGARPPRAFHGSWWLALGGMFLVVLLTANVRPRFRLFLEPYWAVGCAALVEAAFLAARRWRPGNSERPAPEPASKAQ